MNTFQTITKVEDLLAHQGLLEDFEEVYEKRQQPKPFPKHKCMRSMHLDFKPVPNSLLVGSSFELSQLQKYPFPALAQIQMNWPLPVYIPLHQIPWDTLKHMDIPHLHKYDEKRIKKYTEKIIASCLFDCDGFEGIPTPHTISQLVVTPTPLPDTECNDSNHRLKFLYPLLPNTAVCETCYATVECFDCCWDLEAHETNYWKGRYMNRSNYKDEKHCTTCNNTRCVENCAECESASCTCGCPKGCMC